jgi:FdrA protein
MLDVVLGHGAHQDPAAELAPAIATALAGRALADRDLAGRALAGRDLTVVASLIGARSDPQNLTAQANALAGAGAHVFASNAAAARFACDRVTGGTP